MFCFDWKSTVDSRAPSSVEISIVELHIFEKKFLHWLIAIFWTQKTSLQNSLVLVWVSVTDVYRKPPHCQQSWAGPGGRSCRGSIPLTRSGQSCNAQPIPILGSKPTMARVWSCLLLGRFCKGGAVKGREAGHGPGAGGEEAAGPQAGAASGDREGPCGQRPGCFREERVINPWGIRIWATCQWTPDMFLAASSPSVSL